MHLDKNIAMLPWNLPIGFFLAIWTGYLSPIFFKKNLHCVTNPYKRPELKKKKLHEELKN